MTDDELDRALFALPLAEPPADLRASILAATVLAPPRPRLVFRSIDIVLAAIVLAVATWLALSPATLNGAIDGVVAAVEHTGGLTELTCWIGIGIALAMASSMLPTRLLRRPRP